MSANIYKIEDFKKMVSQQVGIIERYELESHKFSIMFFLDDDYSPEKLLKVLEGSLRKSDAIFSVGNMYFLILPGTDKEGAIHILNVLSEFFKKSIPEVIVTYPEDADNDKDLLKDFEHYVLENYKINLKNYI